MQRRKSIGDHSMEMLPAPPSFPDVACKHFKPWENSNWRPSVSPIMRSNTGMRSWVFGNEAAQWRRVRLSWAGLGFTHAAEVRPNKGDVRLDLKNRPSLRL